MKVGGKILLSSALVFAGCSSLGPKPHVMYHRPDLGVADRHVIVLPTITPSGERTKEAKDLDTAILSGWSEMYGAKNAIPIGLLFDEINRNDPGILRKLVVSMDAVSLVEQLHKDPKINQAVSTITNKFGKFNFGAALIVGNASDYENKREIRIHLGLFDSGALTWKWITKIADTKGPYGNWTAASSLMVTNSFDLAKKVDVAEKSMVDRSTASN